MFQNCFCVIQYSLPSLHMIRAVFFTFIFVRPSVNFLELIVFNSIRTKVIMGRPTSEALCHGKGRTARRRSKIEDRGSRIEDRGSRIEDRGSRIEDRGSRIEDRGSLVLGDLRSSILDPLSSMAWLTLNRRADRCKAGVRASLS